MAFRVDDLVVSDKNVYLVHGNRQLYTDIEKTTNAEIDEYKNAWNLSLSDGSILHNIFDSSDVDIQSQIYRRQTNGITKKEEYNNLEVYAPSKDKVVGLTQLFNNAYSITDTTTSSISSIVYTNNSMNTYETFVDRQAISKYEPVNDIINSIENYVSTQASLTISDGLQYLVEYPFGKYYGEFGDNETLDRIIVYGDAINVKNHLNENYSVEGIDSKNNTTINSYFKKFRTYYNIDSTGNSIYLVYKNDKNGHASYDASETTITNGASSIQPRFDTISMLSDFVMIETTEKLYCSNSIDELFSESNKSIRTAEGSTIAYPKNGSFSLRINQSGDINSSGNTNSLCYIPRVGNIELYSSELSGIQSAEYFEFENNVFCFLRIKDEKPKIINVVSNENTDGYNNIFYEPVVGTKNEKYEEILEKFNIYSIEKISDDTLAMICYLTEEASYGPDKYYYYLFVSTPVDGITGNYFRLVVPYTFSLTTNKEISHDNVLNSSITTVETTTSGDNITTTKNIYSYGALSDGVSAIMETIETRSPRGQILSASSSTKIQEKDSTIETQFDPSNIESYKNYNIYASIEGNGGRDKPSNVKSAILNMDCGEQQKGLYTFVQFEIDNYNVLTYFILDNVDKNIPYIKTSKVSPSTTFPINEYGGKFDDAWFIPQPEQVTSNVGYYIDYPGEHRQDYKNTIYGGLLVRYKIVVTTTSDITYRLTFSAFPLNDREDKIVENKNNLSNIYVDDDNVLDKNHHSYLFGYEIKNSYFTPTNEFKYDEGNDLVISLAYLPIQNDPEDGVSIVNQSDSYLVYNGICTEVYIETTLDNSGDEKVYNSKIYQYPHPCYGKLATAGTHLPIFDGRLSYDHNVECNKCRIINGYFVCMNYNVDRVSAHTPEEVKESVRVSLSHVPIDKYPTGGYVVTDNLLSTTDVSKLYSAELKYTNEEYNKNNYVQLWHVRPTGFVEFYPKSYDDKEWKPFYAGKNIIDIVYAGGFYYIMLDDNTKIGYDIIETPSLFEEQEYTYIEDYTHITNFRAFEKYAVVEYKNKKTNTRYVKWFKYGYAKYKYDFLYSISSSQNVLSSSVATANIELNKTQATLPSKYDNVEQVYSINRFIPNNVHKSQYFSIKVEDLGIDNSDYLSDSQKEFVKMWIKNNITEIVNKNKPAQTELLQVYLD